LTSAALSSAGSTLCRPEECSATIVRVFTVCLLRRLVLIGPYGTPGQTL